MHNANTNKLVLFYLIVLH